ncbi:MAG: hydrogen peroxide-inducible genes activator [Parvibaculaceae bacterium]
MPTLRQLRYFDALASHAHFRRAAAQAHVTQPALSMQIADFERELGVPLVERQARATVLTEEGREVARRAREILLAVDDLVDYARHHRAPLTGSLRVGVIPTVAPYLLPRVLPLLKEHYPELRLRLRESQTAVLVEEVFAGQLDAALLALPVEHDGIETMALFEDAFLLAMPESHRLAGRDHVSPKEIAGEPLLLLEEGHCLRQQTMAVCRNAGATQFDTFGATSLATLSELVINGYGLTLLPEICVSFEARRRRLAVRPFADPVPARTLVLAWRKTSPRRKDFEAFGRTIIAARGDGGGTNRGSPA